MTFVLVVLVIFLAVATVSASLTCHALRDFSRSKLKDICVLHGREERFGTILRQHELALLAVEALFIVLMVCLTAVVASSTSLTSLPAMTTIGWVVWLAQWQAFVVAVVVTLLLLPWTVSRVGGERILCNVWPVVQVLVRFEGSCLSMATKTDRLVHRLFGLPEPENGDASTLTEEIRSVVDEGQLEGVLESEARTMIHRVMELQEEDVAAIMTPRTDMVTIPVETSLADARNRILESGHSRIPVIGKSPDDVLGILYARDLLKHIDADEASQPALIGIIREAFYVPETKGIDDLLETMKHRRVQLAIVVDEYSGVAGLVTMEDALEEIVGEIVDEYDDDEPTELIQSDGNGQIIVDARVHIDDLNEGFNYKLPEDGDFDTIGGFVLSEFGRIPTAGEGFHWRQLRFTVLEADERRLHRLKIDIDRSVAAATVDD